jgi:hypothetical protein
VRLYAVLKHAISRICPVMNYCRRCGRRTEAFMVEDTLWARAGFRERDIVCFRHFYWRAARQLGGLCVRVEEMP